tara:strand:+ start:665 stop:1660 length:996 start_codon:yes stop_codon:yes gene_type:complete
MKYSLSIIIPFYNSVKTIDRCLSSVFKSKFKNYEVIAVSDNSNDGSNDIVKKYSCKLINLKKNVGAAAARNAGAKIAKSDILVFLDSDVIIKKNALEIINKNFKDKKINLIQGIYSHKPNYKKFTTQFLQSHLCYYLFSKNRKFTESLCTCFASIRKKIFFELNGFDEIFDSSNSEDEDLGYRLIEKGYVIPIDRRLNAIHDVDVSLFDFIKRSLKMHFGEMKLYLRKKKITKKIQQGNNFSIILGIGLMFWISFLPIINIFFNIPKFYELFLILNFSLIFISFNFLKFMFVNKGFMNTIMSVPLIYLDRFLMMICAIFAILDFYLLGNNS